MIRKTLTILSLVGLVASVAAWVVSYFSVSYCWEIAPYTPSATTTEAKANARAIDLQRGGFRWRYTYVHPVARSEWLGLSVRSTSSTSTGPQGLHWLPYYSGGWRQLFIPLWLPAVIFGAACVGLRQPSRRKRRKLGLCTNCGYDLRGSSEKCPECGAGIVDRDSWIGKSEVPRSQVSRSHGLRSKR